MTQLATLAPHKDRGQATYPASAYKQLERNIEAATADMSSAQRTLMLAHFLGRATRRAARELSQRPEWLRTALRAQGEELVTRLVKENWEHTGSTATVREKFRIASSTLHREKDQGFVIAYRPDDQGEFLFPLEQFVADGFEDWPNHVIRAVGNGAPALHFIYTKRKSLGGRSFAEALRDTNTDNDVREQVVMAAQRLASDSNK